MKRPPYFRSRRTAIPSFGLFVALFGASSGCQIIADPDRSAIETGGSGGNGTGGVGGEAGMGGSGGMAACFKASDCPGTDTDCRTRTCTNGVCGFSNTPNGTPITTQIVGDCKHDVCDGSGAVISENDSTDTLDDLNDCTTDSCNGGTPENTPSAKGSACTSSNGKVCDGQGSCVECNDTADCTSGVCTSNQCVPAICSDGVKNGNETDIDCGGSDCAPCGDGLHCDVAPDCQSGVCTGNTCSIPSCVDMVENGAETDIDCGGNTCAPCGPGLGCTKDGDCIGGSCSGSVCLATCTDQVKNGNETGIDCGGSCATKCANGQGCNSGMDCTSGLCSMMVCQSDMCADMNKNGLETDVDCGGGTCPACGEGKVCIQNGDCASNLCAGGLCVGSVCGDGKLSGSEACDDGNVKVGDGCSATCTIEMGYGCSGTPSVCATICGDGIKIGTEACDDGNSNSGDCCSSSCKVESGCEIEPNDTDATANAWSMVAIGNTVKAFNNPDLDKDVFSIVVPPNNKGTLTAEVKNGPLGSTCSNPTQIDSFLTVRNSSGTTLATNDDIVQPTNYCSKVNLTNLDPGTYFVEAKRTALAPAGLATYDYTLQIDLSLVTCGDGVVTSGEACDDNNTTSGDGCSSGCTIEQGWGCSGQPSVCTFTCGNGVVTGNEQCDDGNTTSGDGCSSLCILETKTETEPNNGCAQASGPFALPLLIDGAITPIGDQDYVAITLSTYSDLRIETFAPTYGVCTAGNDTVIELRDTNCSTVLVTDDEDGINSCSLIDSTVTADAAARHLAPGTYYVRVEDYLNNGTIAAYKLQVSLNASCGNGIKEGSEQCDGGANCGADCILLPFCGDGLVANGEQCDDGGTTNGDGCSSTCTVEADYRCTGTPSSCSKYETNCNDNVDNDGDGNVDAADSDCALPAYFPACMPGQTLRVYKSFDTPQAIPDNNATGVTSNIWIANNIGIVASSALVLNVTHTWDEDVDVLLTSPSNASFDVTSDNGGSDDNYASTVFQDSCPPVTSATGPFAACYAPEASFMSLAGLSAQGLWKLRVTDDATDDFGTLNGWALVLCIAP